MNPAQLRARLTPGEYQVRFPLWFWLIPWPFLTILADIPNMFLGIKIVFGSDGNLRVLPLTKSLDERSDRLVRDRAHSADPQVSSFKETSIVLLHSLINFSRVWRRMIHWKAERVHRVSCFHLLFFVPRLKNVFPSCFIIENAELPLTEGEKRKKAPKLHSTVSVDALRKKSGPPAFASPVSTAHSKNPSASTSKTAETLKMPKGRSRAKENKTTSARAVTNLPRIDDDLMEPSSPVVFVDPEENSKDSVDNEDSSSSKIVFDWPYSLGWVYFNVFFCHRFLNRRCCTEERLKASHYSRWRWLGYAEEIGFSFLCPLHQPFRVYGQRQWGLEEGKRSVSCHWKRGDRGSWDYKPIASQSLSTDPSIGLLEGFGKCQVGRKISSLGSWSVAFCWPPSKLILKTKSIV